MEKEQIEKIMKAGKIASEVKAYAKKFIKKDQSLLEIAEKIEDKIFELGGKPAFPTNLSINEIAAHYTPTFNDMSIAQGILKIDLGVHFDGYVADTAFSLDLDNSEENKKLIEASELALKKAIEQVKKNPSTEINKIGNEINNAMEEKDFIPIMNLSGHSIENYNLHSGISIPNFDNKDKTKLEKNQVYAIEPFATLKTGSGKVHDGQPSDIYMFLEKKPVRSPLARQVLQYIQENYNTLPFCGRWIVKKFSPRAMFALKELTRNGTLHNFPQLIESSRKKVSQAENTIFINDKNEVIVTSD